MKTLKTINMDSNKEVGMKKLGLILVMFVLVMGFSSSAYALATISLFDSAVMGAPVLIEDGGLFDADGMLDGNVTYIEAVSGLLGGSGSIFSTVVVTTGLTTLGPPGFPRLDLNNISVSSTGAGTLTIGFSDDSFTFSPVLNGWNALIGGTTNGTISYSALLDDGPGGMLFSGVSLGSTGVLGPGLVGGSFASSLTPTAGMYALTQFVTITHTAGGQASSFNAELTAAPEPTTLVLLGFGLLGVGYLGRRKSRK